MYKMQADHIPKCVYIHLSCLHWYGCRKWANLGDLVAKFVAKKKDKQFSYVDCYCFG